MGETRPDLSKVGNRVHVVDLLVPELGIDENCVNSLRFLRKGKLENALC